MRYINDVIGLEFDIETGKDKKGELKVYRFRIYRVYAAKKERVKPKESSPDQHYLFDIFDEVVLCEEPFMAQLHCYYDEYSHIAVSIHTPMCIETVGTLKSSYGYDHFPVYPTIGDVENLKIFIEKIKAKLNEIKDRYPEYKKEKIPLGTKASY